ATPTGPLMARYGATTLQTNTWYHVAGVYDATARTLNVYLNGKLDNGTLSGTVASTQQTSTGNVNIGKRPGVTVTEFAGSIDEIQIYSRALTQSEVQAVMSNSQSVALSNLDRGRAGDFDGDGRSDFAVFRPTTGEWFLQLSSLAFGVNGGRF